MDSNILLYTTENSDINIQVHYVDGTFWLTQKRMAELFGVDVRTVNEHLKNIFRSGEPPQEGTIRNFRIVQTEGSRKVQREVAFYPLEAIISVGYRVNSTQAIHFRQWVTKTLNAFVQNKLHWAISGQTAAEIIYEKADATQPHMGLTTWRHAPDGKVMKSDVTIAKNYLDQKHMAAINRLVSAYLDLAEDRAEREIPMLDDFLVIAGRPLLNSAGSISALEAKLKAECEYETFRRKQDEMYISDFDQEIKRLKGDGI